MCKYFILSIHIQVQVANLQTWWLIASCFLWFKELSKTGHTSGFVGHASACMLFSQNRWDEKLWWQGGLLDLLVTFGYSTQTLTFWRLGIHFGIACETWVRASNYKNIRIASLGFCLLFFKKSMINVYPFEFFYSIVTQQSIFCLLIFCVEQKLFKKVRLWWYLKCSSSLFLTPDKNYSRFCTVWLG